MSNARLISHWDHLIDGFQYSPQAFYTALEEALTKRTIPDTKTIRIELDEGPVLSGKRIYLRVTREELSFDICAAPFGSGFFVSWWLGKPSRRGLLYALLLVGAIVAFPAVVVILGVMMQIFGVLNGVVGTLSIVLVGIAGLGYFIRRGVLGIEDEVLALPIVGAIYDWIYKPSTYYRLDTASMFQHTVHIAVLEVIDSITNTGGVRALSEFERKPILREFYRRAG
ncbi:MAG: hypothetical protein ACKVXR_16835 [Planctomycetota bacterium]